MDELELLHFEKEQKDIKEYCIKYGQTIKYRNKVFYLYQHTIYDKDMNTVIEYAENGFLDLFEYHEYFEQPIY